MRITRLLRLAVAVAAAVAAGAEAVLGERPVVHGVGRAGRELLEGLQGAAGHLAGRGALGRVVALRREALGRQRRDAGQDRHQVVADLVVARVVPRARGAAVPLLLLGGLDALGAGVDAARGDAAVVEPGVVGAVVERALDGRAALRAEPVVEDVLDLARALRAGRVLDALLGVVAVAVIDAENVIRRAQHVV